MQNSKLDILVVAPHPDDAELGMGGAIMKFLSEGLRVGVLDLTSGEPTPHGSLETRRKETRAAGEILGLDWRENLGLPNRSLEPTIGCPGTIGRRVSANSAAMDFRPLLDRRPSRPCGRHAIDRGRSILVETDKNRHARRTVLSRADLLLLLRPPANNPPARVCVGY